MEKLVCYGWSVFKTVDNYFVTIPSIQRGSLTFLCFSLYTTGFIVRPKISAVISEKPLCCSSIFAGMWRGEQVHSLSGKHSPDFCKISIEDLQKPKAFINLSGFPQAHSSEAVGMPQMLFKSSYRVVACQTTPGDPRACSLGEKHLL